MQTGRGHVGRGQSAGCRQSQARKERLEAGGPVDTGFQGESGRQAAVAGRQESQKVVDRQAGRRRLLGRQGMVL
jgi:hypothetical protein